MILTVIQRLHLEDELHTVGTVAELELVVVDMFGRYQPFLVHILPKLPYVLLRLGPLQAAFQEENHAGGIQQSNLFE